MYIDLTKLFGSHTDFDETLQIDLDEESVRLVDAVRIWGNLHKGIAQVDIDGKVSANIEIECSRCLSPIKSTLEVAFKVAYVEEDNYTKEKDSELHGEDLDVAIYDGEKIDLTELAREQILLNLPTQTFCREDCQGLCPKCGANLNQKQCDCETKEIDPRWQSLRGLKIKN